jgi:hypothetical protein
MSASTQAPFPRSRGSSGAPAGLSPSVITRLTTQWQDEQRVFMNRSLQACDLVYVWVDGVRFNIRLEKDRLCVLMMVGVRLDGTKELVAIRDGYRESKESWADLLRDLKRRGMRAPVLAVGDTLVRRAAPSLLEIYGVGVHTAAILLVAAGDTASAGKRSCVRASVWRCAAARVVGEG